MASLKKFTLSAVPNALRHNTRQIANSSNKDIDPTLSGQNYSLAPAYDGSDYERFKQRLGELYCYHRADVKVMAGWIITTPKELVTLDQQKAFIQTTYNFLEERYGRANVIQAVAHFDEGKREILRDEKGKPVTDAAGMPVMQLVEGRPHLHFCFIPAAPDPKHVQGAKVCANDVLNRREMQRFHPDLQAYLKGHGIAGDVLTGVTKAQGGSRTVDDLKREYELNKELTALREKVRQYEDRDRNRSREFGRW